MLKRITDNEENIIAYIRAYEKKQLAEVGIWNYENMNYTIVKFLRDIEAVRLYKKVENGIDNSMDLNEIELRYFA